MIIVLLAIWVLGGLGLALLVGGAVRVADRRSLVAIAPDHPETHPPVAA